MPDEDGLLRQEKSVFERSGSPVLSSLVEEKKVSRSYSNGLIPVAFDKETGELVEIRFDGMTRVGSFAPSGMGKTLLAKAAISRAYKAGFKVFHGSDVKNDFQKVDCYGGVSKELRESLGLLDGEHPMEMDRTLAVPEFMVDNYSGNPSSYGTRFSLGFQDITESDFRSLLGYGSLTSTQRDELDVILEDVDISDTNWSYLIDEAEGRNKALARKFRSMRSKNVLMPEQRKDVLLDLNEKGCLSLGLKGWENYLGSGMEKLRFYSGMLHRNLVNYVESGKVSPPILIFNDEFHKMAPDGSDSMVKEEFQNILDLSGRQNMISTWISAQRPSQIPYPESDDAYDFLGTLNHIFLGFNLSGPDWKSALKATPLWDPHHSDRWGERLRDLGKYDFLYIDVENHDGPGDAQVVRSLAPLVAHTG